MRISLIGPGDIEFHYTQLLGLSKKELEKEIQGIARALADSGAEIELLPDKGICIEIAKLYKQNKGEKVVGAVPKSDRTFGISHLEQYISTEIDGKKLFEEIIDTGDWFKHDMIKGLMGNAILYLGSSPGTDGERHYAVYLYKLIAGFKKGVDVSASSLHKEARAGKNFTIFVYSPFLKVGKLAEEDEAYMKKFNVNLVYLSSPEQLKKELSRLI
ncbi:MAG: hypothetical protein ABH840_04225 [Nanoarchaeota archaeon]